MKRKKGRFQKDTGAYNFLPILIPAAILLAFAVSGVLISQHRGTRSERDHVFKESATVTQPSASILMDNFKSTNQSPAEKYLYEEIMPQYNTKLSKIETTYYCQTYGGMGGGAYATISLDNFYDFEDIEPWLLAYNMADYNADGIEDLFVITLDTSGEGNIRQVNITRRIFFFDNDGHAECRCWHATKASASERKRVFIFVEDKLIEMSFFDTSEHTEGDNEDTIFYPVTGKVYYHTDALDVRTFNQETSDLDFVASFTRRIDVSGYSSCSIDYEDCESEQAGISEFQNLLSEYHISGIVFPQSSTWDNRWENIFFLPDGTDYPSFAFDSSPTISEKCDDIGQLGQQHDGKKALNTTKGTMTFFRY